MARVRPIRLSGAEVGFLQEALAYYEAGMPNLKLLASVRAKLVAAVAEQPKRLAPGPLEDALLAAARGKAVATTESAYGRVSVQATAVGASVEAMAVVGAWLARAKWLTEPVTILTVLNKWAEWYPRARATATPAGTAEGLGRQANVGQGPGGRGQPASTGRPAQGFGGARSNARPNGVRED